MLSSITGPQSSNILAGLSARQATASGSTASFTEQLAAALEGYLGKSANGSHLEIDIQTTQSQNSGVRQFLVTVKDPASAPAQTVAAASTGASEAASTSTSPASASLVSPSVAATADPSPSQPSTNPAMAEIDAYWAAQPPEVQKLRAVGDFGERNVLAQQLADQGYTIDRAIMVWGWDPMKTMLTRKMYGYSWVPSFNQASVSAAPGFALPGQTPYNPGNPPPGSIAVNTDFASAADIANAWT